MTEKTSERHVTTQTEVTTTEVTDDDLENVAGGAARPIPIFERGTPRPGVDPRKV